MKEDTYPAKKANLRFSVSFEDLGFCIGVDGINDQLETLWHTILNHFKAFEDNIKDDHFEALLKQQKKIYYNILIDPYYLSNDVKQFARKNIHR